MLSPELLTKTNTKPNLLVTMADQGARTNNVDEVLVLLEDVSKNSEEIRNENRALRLEIQKRDEEHRKAYNNLEQKLQDITNLCSSGNNKQITRRARRRKDEKIIVPIQCRVSFALEALTFCAPFSMHNEFY